MGSRHEIAKIRRAIAAVLAPGNSEVAVVRNEYETGPSTKNPLAAKAAVRRGSKWPWRGEKCWHATSPIVQEAQIEPQARSILRRHASDA